MASLYWYNIVPYIKKTLKISIPFLLHPVTGKKMAVRDLSRILPEELVRQELLKEEYADQEKIVIPRAVLALYQSYRPTPLIRARKLERELGIRKVKIFYKREDRNFIGSYKLNSSFAQAYYAKKEGSRILVGDTGPGNWGLGMALACRHFNLQAVIYMQENNYAARIGKVRIMERLGARVIPIKTGKGTIAASISTAIETVRSTPGSKLSLGCLSIYAALHNTVIGVELQDQLRTMNVIPDALIGVVGGGSSFSGFVFPFIKEYSGRTKFIAVESTRVPSFTRGEYRYENPDAAGLMPRAMMYTLGNTFSPKGRMVESGLNYHGKNPLLSLLVHYGIVRPIAYSFEDVVMWRDVFQRTEGILPAFESCYALKGVIEQAKEWNGQDKAVVFCITGNEE